MTKCIYCNNEVIDSMSSNVCQCCMLEGNYYQGGSVYAYDPNEEYQ